MSRRSSSKTAKTTAKLAAPSTEKSVESAPTDARLVALHEDNRALRAEVEALREALTVAETKLASPPEEIGAGALQVARQLDALYRRFPWFLNFAGRAIRKLGRRHRDYTQHGEQELIFKFFREEKTPYSHYCVDAGAFDGLTGSNSRALFESGWSGIVIEPNPRTFERLRALYHNRPDIHCLRVAVSDRAMRDVEMQFSVGPAGVSEQDKWKYAQVSTLSQPLAELYGQDMGYRYESSRVDIVTLSALMQTHAVPRDLGFLSIDCEGEDLKILHELDLTLFHPRLVCVEADEHHRQLYTEVLGAKGYRYYAHTPGNTLFSRIQP